MISVFNNPFAEGVERTFWEMCVHRDIEAFLAGDWSITEADFDEEEFFGMDACGSNDPRNWLPKYPTLDAYRREFDIQAKEFTGFDFAEDPRAALYSALQLSDPQINGDRAVIVKTFDGGILLDNGSTHVLEWRSIFHLRCKKNVWRFTGFTGYLPLQ